MNIDELRCKVFDQIEIITPLVLKESNMHIQRTLLLSIRAAEETALVASSEDLPADMLYQMLVNADIALAKLIEIYTR